jgi:hypothetical protein
MKATEELSLEISCDQLMSQSFSKKAVQEQTNG